MQPNHKPRRVLKSSVKGKFLFSILLLTLIVIQQMTSYGLFSKDSRASQTLSAEFEQETITLGDTAVLDIASTATEAEEITVQLADNLSVDTNQLEVQLANAGKQTEVSYDETKNEAVITFSTEEKERSLALPVLALESGNYTNIINGDTEVQLTVVSPTGESGDSVTADKETETATNSADNSSSKETAADSTNTPASDTEVVEDLTGSNASKSAEDTATVPTRKNTASLVKPASNYVGTGTYYQVFPDDNLRAYVIKRLADLKDAQGRPTPITVTDTTAVNQNTLNKIESLGPTPANGAFYVTTEVANLEGMQYLNNITYITFTNPTFTDLAPLSEMTQLKYLHIFYKTAPATVPDLQPLEGLNNLYYLALMRSGITDTSNINSLSKLAGLTNLVLSYNELTSLEVLPELTNLQELTVTQNKLTTFNGIEDLKVLVSLVANVNPGLVDLNGIEKAVLTLTTVNVQGCNINDLSHLENNTTITSLSAGNNKITDVDLPIVSAMTQLTSLNLQSNQLENLSLLSTLVNLTTLNISSNQIKDITPLSGMTKLIQFNSSDNQIRDISPLEKIIGQLSSKSTFSGQKIYLEDTYVGYEEEFKVVNTNSNLFTGFTDSVGTFNYDNSNLSWSTVGANSLAWSTPVVGYVPNPNNTNPPDPDQLYFSGTVYQNVKKGKLVNKENPDEEIANVPDGGKETGSIDSLRIDVVPMFSFGSNTIPVATKTYPAKATDSHYLQITEGRNGSTGYSLSAELTTQFTNGSDNNVLTGASLEFSSVVSKAESTVVTKPVIESTLPPFTLAYGSSAVKIASAEAINSEGISIIDFGTGSNVKLTVPVGTGGASLITEGTYTGTITWTLGDTP